MIGLGVPEASNDVPSGSGPQPIAVALLATAILVLVLLVDRARARKHAARSMPSSTTNPASPPSEPPPAGRPREVVAAAPRPFSGPQPGWVSVWVGDFTDELDLDGYLGRPFDRDHGTSEGGEGEYRVGPEARTIEEVLASCYLAPKWAPRMAAVARSRGIDTATCVLVNVHYRHEERTPAKGPMRFIGSFPF